MGRFLTGVLGVVLAGAMAAPAAAAVIRAEYRGVVASVTDAGDLMWGGALQRGAAFTATIDFDDDIGEFVTGSNPATGASAAWQFGGPPSTAPTPFVSGSIAMGGRVIDLPAEMAMILYGQMRWYDTGSPGALWQTWLTHERTQGAVTTRQVAGFSVYDQIEDDNALPSGPAPIFTSALVDPYGIGTPRPGDMAGWGYFAYGDGTIDTDVRLGLSWVKTAALPPSVPLPASGLLLIAGLGALAARRRRV